MKFVLIVSLCAVFTMVDRSASAFCTSNLQIEGLFHPAHSAPSLGSSLLDL